ncbi:RDD family protein [Photobacterium swingsii]|uniref:RDD family protein n=1 Tax=Photobacterium swingsii TaxID=680026 RepID=UPI004067F155
MIFTGAQMKIRRLLAYILDVIPITIFVTAYFWYFQGFNETFTLFIENQRDLTVKAMFLEERNVIRNFASILCIVYFVIFEGSNTKNTLGKSILRIRVEDADGNELTYKQSLSRNIAKFLSILPGGLGLLYPLFNKERLFLHEKISKTRVRKL